MRRRTGSCGCGSREPTGTQRRYLLVDHLRWLERERLPLSSVTLGDLQRYMGAVGAKVAGPFGQPWREGKRTYGQATLSLAAACLKGFYLHQAAFGVNEDLGRQLDRTRLPNRADRNRALLGHVKTAMPGNPLVRTGAAPASEDGAGGGEGNAAGDGALGPRPDGGDLAGRRRLPDR